MEPGEPQLALGRLGSHLPALSGTTPRILSTLPAWTPSGREVLWGTLCQGGDGPGHQRDQGGVRARGAGKRGTRRKGERQKESGGWGRQGRPLGECPTRPEHGAGDTQAGQGPAETTAPTGSQCPPLPGSPQTPDLRAVQTLPAPTRPCTLTELPDMVEPEGQWQWRPGDGWGP